MYMYVCVKKLKHKAVAYVSERNYHAESDSVKRQDHKKKKKEVVSESV